MARGEDLLKPEYDATGVYCALSFDGPDLLATCLDRGIRVPEDLSIIGQDDAREKQIIRPAMTTVTMRSEEMGKMAARTVIDKVEGKGVANVMLEPKLIIRNSTGTPLK